jgi:apolipoprotein N-acyltransferase
VKARGVGAAVARAPWLPWLLGGVALGLPFLFDALEPLILLAPLPWLWAIEHAPERLIRRAYLGGFAFVFTGLSWLHHVSPIAVVLAAAYFAVYPVAGVLLMARLRHGLGLPLWIVAPPCVVATETLAQHVTVFPVTWLFQGHALWRATWLVQVAELGGISIVSALVWLTAASLHHVLWSCAGAGRPPRAWRTWLPAGVAAASLAAAFAYGAIRIGSAGEEAGPRVALVQGNVAQTVRVRPERFAEVVDKHVGLTLGLRGKALDVVAWPESAAAYALEAEPVVARRLAECAAVVRAPLVVGAIGLNPDLDPPAPSNSAFLVEAHGGIAARADKRVLVPGAETLLVLDHVPPIRDALVELLHRTMGFRPFLHAGDRARPFRVGRFVIGTLICYDDLVPGPAEELAESGARALVVISNEAWFGKRELEQHLAMATLRCIETRLPMARCTNTGITCVVDPAGRVTERLATDRDGVLVADLRCWTARAVPGGVRRRVTWLVTGAVLLAVACSLRGRRS